jgi:flotillin
MEFLGFELSVFVLAIGGLFVFALLILMIRGMLRWIVKVPPNKALLVYGFRTRSKVSVMRRVPVVESEGGDGGHAREYTISTEDAEVNYRIVRGGWTLVFPVVHEVKELDLSLMTLEVVVQNVLSSKAVPITVDGIAQIKIGGDETYIATAAEQLLDKDQMEVEHVAKETLMGHLRAIIGLMTVENVYKDREEFAQRVLEVAVDDLAGMGLEIVSFVIKDIDDAKGYIEALGRPEIAAKIRDARVAEAETDREATDKEQSAEKEKADYVKTTNVAKAQFDAQVATERAVADRAEAISLAEQDKLLEVRKADAAEQAALRRDKELDVETRRPADANLYASEKTADAARAKGFADADITQKLGEAEAEADKAKGLAQADVTQAQLTAEAKGRAQLVEAFNQYGPGALQLVLGEMFINNLPAYAEAATKHIAEIDEVRIVDLGGGGDGSNTPVFEQFADQGLRVATKILQGAPVVVSDLLDDIVAALVAKKAEDLGIDVGKTDEPDTPAASEEGEQDVVQVKAEEVTPDPEDKPPAKPRRTRTRRKKTDQE